MNIDTKIDCVKREYKRREESFPYIVRAGRMEQDVADFEIATMRAVLETLTQLRGIVGDIQS